MGEGPQCEGQDAGTTTARCGSAVRNRTFHRGRERDRGDPVGDAVDAAAIAYELRSPVAEATITPTPANTATRPPTIAASCWSLFIPMVGAYEFRPLGRGLRSL